MHPCLRLEEITSLVCAELKCDLEHHNFVDTNSLLNVALTTKVLLEPALKALWRNQSSLRPLFHLLPEDLWGNVNVHDDDSDINFAETTEESDNDDPKPMVPLVLVCTKPRRILLY